MDTYDKNKSLFDLCKSMSYEDRFVFTNQSNNFNDFYNQKSDEKPKGIWYSIGPAWICYLTNRYSTNGLNPKEEEIINSISHIYKITIKESAIYTIQNKEEFDLFSIEYSNKNKTKVNWKKLQNVGYMGIEIKFQNSTIENWYNSWNCSCGCIWDSHAIENKKEVSSWSMYWRKNEYLRIV